MNRKISAVALLLFSLIWVSCVSDNDDDIDYEWKTLNEEAYNTAYKSGDYNILMSASKNGEVLWRESDTLTDDHLSSSLRITSGGKPEYTDSVTVRYEGWYIQKDGTKYVFDTTEQGYNKTPRGFAVNGVIDGWSTVIQDMKEGEEREIMIPWGIGYGSSGTTTIPAYTTLRFYVKLLKIHQMPGLKS